MSVLSTYNLIYVPIIPEKIARIFGLALFSNGRCRFHIATLLLQLVNDPFDCFFRQIPWFDMFEIIHHIKASSFT